MPVHVNFSIKVFCKMKNAFLRGINSFQFRFFYTSHMSVQNKKIKVKSYFKKESIRLSFKDVKMSYFDIARAFHLVFNSHK